MLPSYHVQRLYQARRTPITNQTDILTFIRCALGVLVVVACVVSTVLIIGIKLFLGPPSDAELDKMEDCRCSQQQHHEGSEEGVGYRHEQDQEEDPRQAHHEDGAA